MHLMLRINTDRRYALALLTAIYMLNFLDRQIVAILAEPIKNDLHLADWQLGVMTGLAFALLYTVLGFPVARLSDRGDRPLIISVALATWSIFTALCGVTQNFAQLLLARVGVGIGEAGCSPAAISLIAELFPKNKRASALGFYAMGAQVGGLLGMAAGGLIAAAWGWRSAFLVAGAPGILVALVTHLTLGEPRRHDRFLLAQPAETPRIAQVVKTLRAKPTFWLVSLGGSLQAIVAYGITAFIGSFFFRNHTAELAVLASQVGMKTVSFLGVALGVTTGVAGIFGTLIGGRLADHFARNDARSYVTVSAAGMLLAVPCYIAVLSIPRADLALLLLAVPTCLSLLWAGVVHAIVQSVVHPRMRATATALLFFITNLIGLGIGPLAIGTVSDFISRGLQLGPAEGIRWSLQIFALMGIPASALFALARRTIARDTES